MVASPAVGGLLPNAMQQFVDGDGAPLANGSVYFYVPGTTTLKTTWQDSALSITNTNPVLLVGDGRALIWGVGSYRQVLYDANGVEVWDQNTGVANYTSVTVAALNTWQTVATGVWGLYCLVDATVGQGSNGLILVGPGGVATTGANNITGLSMRVVGSAIQLELTSGVLPRSLSFTVLVAYTS